MRQLGDTHQRPPDPALTTAEVADIARLVQDPPPVAGAGR